MEKGVWDQGLNVVRVILHGENEDKKPKKKWKEVSKSKP